AVVFVPTMGNQLPTRCVTTCNPACCVACLNPQTARTEDGDGLGLKGTGNIFANASAVLSMAAEDMEDHFDNMSLDDHMEKELANEVELWRMETSSAGA
ncbi:unnamed protein product, partial [Polarella glacialis]